MPRYVFEGVKRAVALNLKCGVCGKRRTRTVSVEHTVSPFNRNPDGTVKTRAEVEADVQKTLTEKVDDLKAKGIICNPCQEGADE